MKQPTVGRKRLLSASVVVMSLMLLVCQIGAQPRAAQPMEDGNGGVFDIVPDAATLSSLPASGNTFFLTGKVYPFRTFNQATCQPNPGVVLEDLQLGTWRAWGEVADEGRLVIHHSLLLSKVNGSIEAQGTTGVTIANEAAGPAILGTVGAPFTGPSEVIPITGGAGTLRGISGEAHIRPYCQSQAETLRPFRYDRAFCFGIVEALRRRDR